MILNKYHQILHQFYFYTYYLILLRPKIISYSNILKESKFFKFNQIY
jgi:hypothetical protein